MATPYCDKFQIFATIKACAECPLYDMPASNRRPPCQYRRPRRWSDLPADDRQLMRGNYELALIHKDILKARHISDELRLAAWKAVDKGRRQVSVPIDRLDALIRLADRVGVSLTAEAASMSLVVGAADVPIAS